MPDDPIAARSAWAVWCFTFYVEWMMRRRFHALRVSRTGLPDVPDDRPVIVYTNHPSWWDPAFFYVLSRRMFAGRHAFGPMERAALDGKYPLFKRLGVYAVDPTPRGAARFLRVAARLLAGGNRVLWITAEGDFTDGRRRPVRLRPGLAHLARAFEGVTMLPLAMEYPFWNESKPEALAHFGRPVVSSPGRSVLAWNELLESELERAMDALAAESMARDPALFRTLSLGRVGVGGPYDLWRAARARWRGERFDASHEGREV
ncbi:MAG: lysophospholipid acyltransferase family protein [Acidisphaera sp.]|nr:lysophospholipid acyltransferase family protein [Acidisphaera sp.]MBV9811302.1 lysophospholipid acyltransferase family protein [Acetobacteraceae bacterium]